MILECPDLTSGPVVEVDALEPLRSHVRSQKTDRLIRAHSQRIARTGTGVPAPLSAAFHVQVIDRSYGRLFVLGTCPFCERRGGKAHITEGSWILRCKRASCEAHAGIGYEKWTVKVDKSARPALRAHLQEDVQRTRMEANMPLRLQGAPDYVVDDYEAGSRAIELALRQFHHEGLALRAAGEKASDRKLLIGADCGTGKTLAASRFADRYGAVFSTLQYSLLDSFFGGSPYQIQGVRKGCKISGLGEVAASRGVSRSFLCHQSGKECGQLASCPAQPRIETGNTPTCVIAALPSVSFGAVVRDGVVLAKDDRGEPIAEGRLLLVDEAPAPFEEVVCTLSQVQEASEEGGFSNQTSRVRGIEFQEFEDALLRLEALECLFRSVARPPLASGLRSKNSRNRGRSRAEVAELIRWMLAEMGKITDLKGARDLFRSEMVIDLTKPGGERPCIPEQRDWTVYAKKRSHQDPEAVRELIAKPVVDTCRAVARVLDEKDSPTHKLVATSSSDERLIILRPRSLSLPDSTGTAVMTAGLPVHLRLFRALHPQAEIRTLWVELAAQSFVSRHLHLTSSFLRSRSRRAFSDESDSSSLEGGSSDTAIGGDPGASKSRAEFLGSLARLLRETATRAAELQTAGQLPSGLLRTLLVAQSEVVRWLTMTNAGQAWLRARVPAPLSVETGNPWHAEPEQWGDVVYFGGRGRGENLWRECRVAITVGDPLPTPPDMRARWGDVTDPETGNLFDPEQVGIWLAQEAVMQAHGRTRPGREGKPTLLVHAGRYLPMGFDEHDEVVYAEGTRVAARCEQTRRRVLDALNAGDTHQTGRVRSSVGEVAKRSGLDRKTVAKYVDAEGSGTMEALWELAQIRESAPIYFKGGIPELAQLQEVALRNIRAARSRGTSLPKAKTVAVLLGQGSDVHQPALRTIQEHLRKIRRDLEGTEPLDVPKRRDTREARAAVLLGVLSHTGLHETPPNPVGDSAGAGEGTGR
jgi:hypothetical protein